MSDPGISAGEAGGVFAGAIALLTLIGTGLKFAIGWGERREASRAAKLQAWHEELEAREKRLDNGQSSYTAKLERRMAEFDNWREARASVDEERDLQVRTLRISTELLSSALRSVAPDHPALRQVDDMLRAAFPVEIAADDDMIGALRQLEQVPSPRRPAKPPSIKQPVTAGPSQEERSP